jgi:nitrile hydratase
MGGMHGFGTVFTPGSDRVADEPWELRVFAMSMLIEIEGLGSGSRRAIREEMEPATYLEAGYYERWLWSAEQSLTRRATIGEREVDTWVERLRAGERAPRRDDPAAAAEAVAATEEAPSLAPALVHRFEPGERVRVRRMRPSGHTRCPRYVRGATGTVAAVRGVDAFPDIGPYAGPDEPVYAIAFASADLFGESPEGHWTVLLDLFESYLEPV